MQRETCEPETALVERRTPGAVDVLLRFLPFVADGKLQEEVWYGVDALASREARMDPALLAALEDPSPARRAAAACIVGRQGTAAQKRAVEQLLRDTDPGVRLRAAQGLLAGMDKAAVPVLVELLSEPSVELAWQAEELLHWVAGEEAPAETVGAGSVAARRQCRRAWAHWWEMHGDRLDLSSPKRFQRCPGLVLVGGPINGTPGPPGARSKPGRVYVCGCDGAPRWQLACPVAPADVQILSGHRVLIAELSANRITERELEGKLVREHPANGPLSLLHRLSGTIYVAERPYAVWQITPAGNTELLRDLEWAGRRIRLRTIEKARLLANGNVLLSEGIRQTPTSSSSRKSPFLPALNGGACRLQGPSVTLADSSH
jgi:hypothetical protein